MAGATPRTVRLQDLPVDVSLSGVARGDLLFRGASKWNNLAAGTSGYYLRSNGAGADPSWASVSASPAGSSGQVQWNSSGSFGGAAYLNYATSGSILTITDGATTDVPLVVDGVASQSGDLQQWKVNGTTKSRITSAGGVYITIDALNAIRVGSTVDSGDFVVHTTGGSRGTYSSYKLVSYPAAASITPVTIQGITSQTAPLLQLQGTSSTTAGRAQAEVDTAWAVDTDASRSADLILRAYYTTTAREGFRIRGGSSDVQLGFYGVTPISRAVLATGAGATVDNVITALQNLGLVKQS